MRKTLLIIAALLLGSGTVANATENTFAGPSLSASADEETAANASITCNNEGSITYEVEEFTNWTKYVITAAVGWDFDSIWLDGFYVEAYEGNQMSHTDCNLYVYDHSITLWVKPTGWASLDIVTKEEAYQTFTIVNNGGGALARYFYGGSSSVRATTVDTVGSTITTTVKVYKDNPNHHFNGLDVDMFTYADGIVTNRGAGKWDDIYGDTIAESAVQLNHVYIDGVEVPLESLRVYFTLGSSIYYSWKFLSSDTASHTIEAVYGPLTDTATCTGSITGLTVDNTFCQNLVSWSDSDAESTFAYSLLLTDTTGSDTLESWTVSGRTWEWMNALAGYSIQVRAHCSLMDTGTVWSEPVLVTFPTDADSTDVTIIAEGAPVYVFVYDADEEGWRQEYTDSIRVVDTTGSRPAILWQEKPDTTVSIYVNGEPFVAGKVAVSSNGYYYRLDIIPGMQGSIRFVFSPKVSTVSVAAVASDPAMGSVVGGGEYEPGDEVRLSALANTGYGFAGWSDGNGDNPRVLTATEDMVLTAMFAALAPATAPDTITVHDTTVTTLIDTLFVHDTTVSIVRDTVVETVTDTVFSTVLDTITLTVHDTITSYVHDTTTVYLTDTLWLTQTDTLWLRDTITIHDTVYIPTEGIDGADAPSAKVYATDGQIVVEGADGSEVALYDAAGRLIATRRDIYSALRFDVPASGVYMIRIGGSPARRVVAIR